MWLFNPDEVQGVVTIIGVTKRAGLADFDDAGHFHDWGLFLPLCKVNGLLMIRIDASKPLTVLVKHNGLPVMVLPPSIFPE
jgi:hypothetical protein